jgi:hypothetical protein
VFSFAPDVNLNTNRVAAAGVVFGFPHSPDQTRFGGILGVHHIVSACTFGSAAA